MGKQVSTIQVTGKIGNIVGYKRSGSKNGAKFARARATDIKNPRTQAQQIQRAITATVGKAYAAGKVILDHSFQGVQVGAASMDKFRRLNMKALRAAIVNDIKNHVPVEDQVGVVVAPGAFCPTVGPWIVSEGTLQQSLFERSSDTDQYPLLHIVLSAAEQAMTVPQFLASRNIAAGDIFTALGYGVVTSNGAFASQYGQLASQPSVAFGFIRFTVKDTSAVQTAMSAAKFEDLFVIEVGGEGAFDGTQAITANVICTDITGFEAGFIGMIRSRENDGHRSSCTLFTGAANNGVSNVSYYGIKSSYLLNAWSPEQDSLGQSDLILEGGNF